MEFGQKTGEQMNSQKHLANLWLDEAADFLACIRSKRKLRLLALGYLVIRYREIRRNPLAESFQNLAKAIEDYCDGVIDISELENTQKRTETEMLSLQSLRVPDKWSGSSEIEWANANQHAFTLSLGLSNTQTIALAIGDLRKITKPDLIGCDVVSLIETACLSGLNCKNDFHLVVEEIIRDQSAESAFTAKWLTNEVESMARDIYIERAFDEMPLLGSVLETAGCQDEKILQHCRENSFHLRGCWVLDFLLSKG